MGKVGVRGWGTPRHVEKQSCSDILYSTTHSGTLLYYGQLINQSIIVGASYI